GRCLVAELVVVVALAESVWIGGLQHLPEHRIEGEVCRMPESVRGRRRKSTVCVIQLGDGTRSFGRLEAPDIEGRRRGPVAETIGACQARSQDSRVVTSAVCRDCEIAKLVVRIGRIDLDGSGATWFD